jgi:hypothetical protein
MHAPHTVPTAPPAPDHPVGEDLLLKLAAPVPIWGADRALVAEVAEALPDIARELLARRRQGPSVPPGALCLDFDERAIDRRLAKARAAFHSAAPMTARALADAATTLAHHSKHPTEVAAAQAVLDGQARERLA